MNNFTSFYFIDSFTDLIETFIVHSDAYTPILLLILEESGIPLPVPGDIIIAYTGYKVSIGSISYISAFVTSLVSVMIGSSFLYYLSARFGQKMIRKFGHILSVNEKKLIMIESNFKKYGPLVIIFGRHIPGFRIPITIFSGISSVPYKTFIVSTFISITLWIPLYLAVGQKLGAKTVNLFHGHHLYFLITLIPFAFFVVSLIYLYLKPQKQKK